MKQASELRVFNFMDILLYNLSESFRQRVIRRNGPQWQYLREHCSSPVYQTETLSGAQRDAGDFKY